MTEEDKKMVEKNVLMSLGALRFSVSTMVYNNFKRNTSYRWNSQDRDGRRPSLQYNGPGSETIDLSGTIYAARGGIGRVDEIRKEAEKGKPLKLMDGLGLDWGLWCITSVEEERNTFLPNGEALKQNFSIKLTAYGDDND